jgi:hypothetical protein
VGEAVVFGRDEPQGAENPVDEKTRVPVQGAEGWFYLPFEQLEDTGEHRITLVREDGAELQMTLPSFVEQGDELAEIARLVIRARERWRDLKGLGA